MAMSDEHKTEDYLKRMWLDEHFSGSYQNGKDFRRHLLIETGRKYSLKSINKMLLSLPQYLMTISKVFICQQLQLWFDTGVTIQVGREDERR